MSSAKWSILVVAACLAVFGMAATAPAESGKQEEVKAEKKSHEKKEGREAKQDDNEDENEDEDKDEVKLPLDQTPEAVQAAVKAAVGADGKLDSVTKEDEDGAVVYEADFVVDGVENSVKVAPSGTVIEKEISVTTSTLPVAVSQALKKAFPKASISKAEEVTVQYYEVNLVDGGKKREVKIDAAGKLEREDEHEGKGKDKDDDDDEKDEDKD